MIEKFDYFLSVKSQRSFIFRSFAKSWLFNKNVDNKNIEYKKMN